MTEMRKLWSKEPCTRCGVEGLASRSEPVPKSKPYVCEGCEMYDRGYADAEKEAQVKLTELKELMVEFEELVEEAQALAGSPYEEWRLWIKRRLATKKLKVVGAS